MQPLFYFLPVFSKAMAGFFLDCNAVFVFNKFQVADCVIILGFAVIVIIEFDL
jgi:lipoprotein signal peptidase